MITADSKAYISLSKPVDAEYESIRTIMLNRGKGANQLPRVTLHFVPEERAATVLALDERIQKVKAYMPLIMTGAIALSFLLGFAL